MKCWLCPRRITPADARGRVEWRSSLTGTTMYGGQDHEPLEAAHGVLLKAAHGKCYHAWRKRRPIGDSSEQQPLEEPPSEDHGSSG